MLNQPVGEVKASFDSAEGIHLVYFVSFVVMFDCFLAT
jgi:hypothetical protein